MALVKNEKWKIVMKGIILAGGHGTRLYPATKQISKQLLPIYDKPMIYYPLCTLMHAGIQEILIITTPHEAHLFKELLKTGEQWGIHLSYAIQSKPQGIAEAFIIGEPFIGSDRVCLILGDNILHGDNLSTRLQQVKKQNQDATIFGYYVADPERYGVVTFDKKDNPLKIMEKPKKSTSNYAVIGLYFYSNEVVEIVKTLKPSARGELEISDINQCFLNQKKLHVEKLGRGIAWLDTGTHKSLLDASNFIYVLEQRQGLKIGSPEEVAWRMGYISAEKLEMLAKTQIKSGYGEYLMTLIN